MARALVLLALLAACRSPARAPETAPPRFAILTPDGIEIRSGSDRVTVPRTNDLDSFCWRRDGGAFFATTGSTLFEVSPGGARRVILDGWRALRFPAAAPNGKRIAVCGRRRNGEPWGVWTLRADGTGRPLRLVDGYAPAWEADGHRIYYERFQPRRGLSVIDISSGATQKFFDTGPLAHTVTCAPSGRMILFTRGRALTLFEPSKSSVRALTDDRTYNRFPSVSPGERYVIFFRQDPSGETHPDRGLVILDLQTGAERILDVDAELAKFAPAP